MVCKNSHVGNSTDGAANMKGQYRGFSAWLSKEIPTPIHVWCDAHDLKLVMPETVFSYQRMNVWEAVSHDPLTQKKFTDWRNKMFFKGSCIQEDLWVFCSDNVCMWT